MLKVKKKKSKKKTNLFKIMLLAVVVIFSFLIGAHKGRIATQLSDYPPFSYLTSFSPNVISAQTLAKSLENKDFTLINVHTPYEGEIEKTDAFIAYDLIKYSLDKLPQNKDARIVLYCNSGNMSAQALETLKSLGYTNVTHLQGGMIAWEKVGNKVIDLAELPKQVVPDAGMSLPVSWGNLGPKLVELGVIDINKFENASGLTLAEKKILTEGTTAPITISTNNSRFVVNLLWAIGLAQKSKVYEEGPMGTEYKDRVKNFASTGGWTLAKGNATNYLDKYLLITLDDQEQERVSEIAKNVYRPCCGNSTWFPDCNHGMAALAAIEMLVAANISDDEIYRNLLVLNAYWFPDNYLMLATHFARQGIDWENVDAKLALSNEFSSSQGANSLYENVGPLPYQTKSGGGSCGA